MLIANDILTDVSVHLLESYSKTTLLDPIIHSPVAQQVRVTSDSSIYVGAKLICDDADSREVVVVTAVAEDKVTAIFSKDHAVGATLFGATFPSGQTTHPLFTQDEVLGYLATVQSDFLVSIHTNFNTAPLRLPASEISVPLPDNAIEILSAYFQFKALMKAEITELDLLGDKWTKPGLPKYFFLDGVSSDSFGIAPPVETPQDLELWFPERGPRTLAINDAMLVPSFFSHIIKYGVLYQCFSKDGETKDPQRADYCDRRYRYGLVLAGVFIGNMDVSATGMAPQRSGRAPKISV